MKDHKSNNIKKPRKKRVDNRPKSARRILLESIEESRLKFAKSDDAERLEFLKSLIKNDLKDNKGIAIPSMMRPRPFLKEWIISQTDYLIPGSKITQRVYHLINPDVEYKQTCGKIKSFKSITDGYRQFCGVGKKCPCRVENQSRKITEYQANLSDDDRNKHLDKQKATMIERHGVEYPMHSQKIKEKVMKGNLEKYGTTMPANQKWVLDRREEETGYRTPFENPDTVKKALDTTNERYGGLMTHARNELDRINNGKNNFQLDYIKEKTKESLLKKYGVDHPLKSEAIKSKRLKTFQEKYNRNCHTQLSYSDIAYEILIDYEKFKEFTVEMTIPELADELGLSWGTANHWFKIHNIDPVRIKTQSQLEKKIIKLLEGNNIHHEPNDRMIIHPKEIDIFIPILDLAIEIDGLYWHSEVANGKTSKYHLEKTEKCLEKGINLIHIFENEIINQWPIIESRIKNLTKCNESIMARKCKILTIPHNEEERFFNETHIQGHINSKICYGLYLEDDLVACMSFTKSRFNKNFEWEILRYSSKLNTNVIGGASKLFAHFIKIHDPNSVITYADRRWGEGKFYEKLGFTFSHSSKPNYHYTESYTSLSSRFEFQKHKLKDKLAVFDSKLTEWENMQINGWDRIWDCGNNVFKWHKD